MGKFFSVAAVMNSSETSALSRMNIESGFSSSNLCMY